MKKIELNEHEKGLAEALGSFEISTDEDYEKRIGKLGRAGLLARSLLERDAIPKARLNYFFEPEYNLGNPKKSIKETFESNGTNGEEILTHPHFLKYLKYFIYGADLPQLLQSELGSLKEEHPYDDEFIEEAALILKTHFKAVGSNHRKKFADEVFKLCLDLDVDLAYAKNLRDRVMKWR